MYSTVNINGQCSGLGSSEDGLIVKQGMGNNFQFSIFGGWGLGDEDQHVEASACKQ